MSRVISTTILSLALIVTGCAPSADSAPASHANSKESLPVADTPNASQVCAPQKHAVLPPVTQLEYPEARKQLLASGWQPYETHRWQDMDEEIPGPMTEQWEAGYKEVEECSANGSVPCSYLYKDAYGNTLRVHASGEILELQSVESFMFVCS